MAIRTKMRSVTVTTISTLLLSFTISTNAQVVSNAPPSQQRDPNAQSIKGAALKGKVPVSKEILNVKLPKAQETTLSNGMRVMLLENHKVPTFSMQMSILTGGIYEPLNMKGVSQLTASMMREGTAKRSSREISEQLDAIGATFSAGSGASGIVSSASVSGLVENLDQTLDIFTDIVRNPKFVPEEFDKLKTRTLAQMQSIRTSPQFIGQERFYRAIYGEHPASLLFAPADSIKRITADDLKQYHQTFYRPNNAILAVTGDITMKELLPKLERLFGDWQKGDIPAGQIPPVKELAKPGIFLIDRPGSVQTTLILGGLGIERKSADYFPLLVMNQVFGDNPASRLFMNIREDKGYTYGVSSQFASLKYPGFVSASSSVRTDVTEGALKEFMYEIKRIREEKVSAIELENAKRSLVGNFALSLEQPQTLLSNALTLKYYDLPANYWDTYPQNVTAITAEDVQRAAQKYYDPARLQIIAVGDAGKIREVLAKYGTVEMYDTDGKAVAAANTKSSNQ